MGLLDRVRRRISAKVRVVPARGGAIGALIARQEAGRVSRGDMDVEIRLRHTLHDDPNDEDAFAQLADLVRRHAAEGHVAESSPVERQRAADDAVWALAEELAQNHRAWRPLVELARLSVHDDREGAMRRLGTAAERDPSGRGLAAGLAVLREAGMPDEALGLGVGHWRPREHVLEAGKHLVAAAVQAGRLAEARRHLKALAEHPDKGRVAPLQAELESSIAAAAALRGQTR